MSRATNDLNAVRMMIGPSIMYSANTLLDLRRRADADGVDRSRGSRCWSLIPLPFVSISVKYFGSAIHKRFEQIQAQLSEVSAVAQEALSGVRVVRAYRQEAGRARAVPPRERRVSAPQPAADRAAGLLLSEHVVLPRARRADRALARQPRGDRRPDHASAQFVAFNAYLTMLSWPMIAFGWVTNMLQRGMASWKRMLEVLDTEPAIADDRDARAADSGARGWR